LNKSIKTIFKLKQLTIYIYYATIFTVKFSKSKIFAWIFRGENKEMAEILEVIMIVSFGASWPLNVIKSYKARTTKGKSLAFLLLILFGYVAGITSKLINTVYMAQIEQKWYVLFFYVLNFIMVTLDLCMYIRNYKLDQLNTLQKENKQ
jgi:hypothetical protein